jgi:prephenate dehydrogenase
MRRWDTVAIIGVGLIGGSIGLALRKRKLAKHVVGVGRRKSSLAKALACGCVTNTTTSVSRGVANAELIVVCTPVEQIAEHVSAAAAHCSDGTIVTDAGSAKAELVAQIDSALVHGRQGRPFFVGSHPIAGSEKTGPEAARADLFEDRVVVVTPTDRTDAGAVAAIEAFWRSLSATVVRMSPEEHDAALAATSHLPHLVASALAAATADELLPLTGSGWQDTTRVAAGDAELWRQIFLANQAHTLKALEDFETVLSRFRNALIHADGALLASLLAEGKRRRDAVGS